MPLVRYGEQTSKIMYCYKGKLLVITTYFIMYFPMYILYLKPEWRKNYLCQVTLVPPSLLQTFANVI